MRRLAFSIAMLGAALLSGCAAPLDASSAPSTEGLSGEELARHELALEGYAAFWGVENPPEYEIVRWVPVEEAGDAREPCMAELGFPRQADGGYFHGDQKDAFDAAMYECSAKYPIHPRYTGEWGPEQFDAQYEWTVQVMVPCIESAGVSVSGVPSRAVFIDSWYSEPYWPMVEVPVSRGAEIENLCPVQQAPTSVLWEGVAPTEHPLAQYEKKQ